MLRLIAYAPDGVRRFAIPGAECFLGSEPGCEIFLPYTGVARRHARIRRDGEALHIEDLGSRRGMLVNGNRVRESELEVLDEVRLGSITLLLEDTKAESAAPAARGAGETAPGEPVMDAQTLTEHLAAVTDWVLADTESRSTLESVVRRALVDFGGGAVYLLQGDDDEAGVKFLVATDSAWLVEASSVLDQVTFDRDREAREKGSFEGELAGERAWVFYRSLVALDRPYILMVVLPEFAVNDEWSPVAGLGALGDLLILGLVHHVGRYEPILPGSGGSQDLIFAPGFVVGESEAMQSVVDAMRSLADPSTHVLLSGEPGVGRELIARSLHLSGPHRHGPFLVASCSGAKLFQIEADLFGAEIAGKDGPVRREAKLVLADGGTLFLEDVDLLPLELQSRLIRFLRTGAVEAPGGGDPTESSVRFIATASERLEELVARDRFRVDLAYRLSQFVIDVPPLRERREDMPLLIQSFVNRFCHESGKRVQGITTKAISALMAHPFPGNLPELEGIVRQMVFLAPNGQPMDANLLPEDVRRSHLHVDSRVDSTTPDLELEPLVARTEERALREALRRSRGNKSHAARLLGLSRNGLSLKMERYGIETP